MKKAGTDYQAAVKEAGRGHTNGAPHCHVLAAALSVLAEGEAADSHIQRLKKYCSTAKQEDILELVPTIYAKENKCSSKRIAKSDTHPDDEVDNGSASTGNDTGLRRGKGHDSDGGQGNADKHSSRNNKEQ